MLAIHLQQIVHSTWNPCGAIATANIWQAVHLRQHQKYSDRPHCAHAGLRSFAVALTARKLMTRCPASTDYVRTLHAETWVPPVSQFNFPGIKSGHPVRCCRISAPIPNMRHESCLCSISRNGRKYVAQVCSSANATPNSDNISSPYGCIKLRSIGGVPVLTLLHGSVYRAFPDKPQTCQNPTEHIKTHHQ